jgi:hypothetical protein
MSIRLLKKNGFTSGNSALNEWDQLLECLLLLVTSYRLGFVYGRSCFVYFIDFQKSVLILISRFTNTPSPPCLILHLSADKKRQIIQGGWIAILVQPTELDAPVFSSVLKLNVRWGSGPHERKSLWPTQSAGFSGLICLVTPSLWKLGLTSSGIFHPWLNVRSILSNDQFLVETTLATE